MPIDVKLVDEPSGDPFLRLDLSTEHDQASVTVTVSFDGDLVKTIGQPHEIEEDLRLEIAQEILHLVYIEFSRSYDDAKSTQGASA